MEKDIYARSRRMYIYEAALEYMTEILVGSTYLAKIASSLGMTASQIGILSSFVSLADGFMLAALLLVRRTPVKRWVVPLSILNQLAFAAMYFIPLLTGKGRGYAWLFTLLLLAAQIVARLTRPAKVNWLMSLVADGRRGVFSANKEIVSLLCGMGFTAAMSAIIDRREAEGELTSAFVLIGVTILVLTVLHTITLIVAKEKEPAPEEDGDRHVLRELISDRTFFIVIGVTILWGIVSNISRPFYGAYEIDELGFSMSFASGLVIAGSFVRMIFSRPMGTIGDKKGFLLMLSAGFGLEFGSLVTAAFSTPENGKILFTVSMILHYSAMAGINSGLVNLVFDYIRPSLRTGAIAVGDALAGLCGFGVTAAMSLAVTEIQNRGNILFGHRIYAQQLLSAIAAVGCIGIIIYICSVRGRLSRGDSPKE